MKFLDYLKKDFEKKLDENHRYSLRAYARYLGIDPSRLSKIFSGKVTLRRKSKEKLLLKMGLEVKEISKILIEDASSKERTFEALNSKSFEIISEWYHFAILEMTKLPDFVTSSKWISLRLGVPLDQIDLAVKNLIELGYLDINSKGEWVDNLGNISTNLTPDQTSEALKAHQLDLLEISKKAINTSNIRKRSHTSTMFVIDKKDITVVKKKIQSFREDLAQYLIREDIQPNSLYQLQVGFFSLMAEEGN